MSDVFISYSRKDADFAKRLTNELSKSRRDVWIDWEDIPRAADWLNEIYSGIESADTFVCIISRHSLSSEVCNYEIAHARENNKRIIPLIRENVDNIIETEIETRWTGQNWEKTARDNWQTLKHLNWIFFDDDQRFEGEFGALVTALDTDLEYVKLHTRLLVRALEWERSGRRPSFLLTGDAIDDAEHWLNDSEGKHPPADTNHRQYISQSRAEETRRRRLIRNLRLAIATFAVIGLMAIALVIGSVIQLENARSEADVIATNVQLARNEIDALELASSAGNVYDRQEYETAALLSVLSLDTLYNEQADLTLQRAYPRLNLMQFMGSTSVVQSVTFSPDGVYVLAGGDDMRVRLWETSSGELVQEFAGHTGRVRSVRFSADGLTILTASEDGTARLWDTAAGQEMLTLTGHEGAVRSAVFSPDGQFIATAGDDATVRLWDSDGQQIRDFEGHTDGVRSLAFSPDGRYLLSAGRDTIARLWEVETGDSIRQFEGHQAMIASVAYSPDGLYIATGSDDQTVRVWEVANGTERWQVSTHRPSVRSVTFSPDGLYVLSSGADGAARIWNAVNGQPIWSFVSGHDAVQTAAFSPEGEYIVTGTYDATVRLWQFETDAALRTYQLPQNRSEVWSASFSPDGTRILTSDANGRAIIYEPTTGAMIQILEGHSGKVTSAIWSPDGSRILTTSEDKTIIIWDATTYEQMLKYEGHPSGVFTASWVGRYIASGGDDQQVRIWDSTTGETLRIFNIRAGAVRRVVFSPDGRQLLIGTDNQPYAQRWDVVTGERLLTFEGATQAVWAAALSPDGTSSIIGSDNRRAWIYDSEGAVNELLWQHTGGILSAAWSHNGLYVATGSRDGTARIFEVATGKPVRVFIGHNSAVKAVAFSPDDHYLLTASEDGRARLWVIDVFDFVSTACERLYRDLTQDERSRYVSLVPGTDSEPATCDKFTADNIPDLNSTWTPAAIEDAAATDVPLLTFTPSSTPTETVATSPEATFTATITPTQTAVNNQLLLTPYETPTLPVFTPLPPAESLP